MFYISLFQIGGAFAPPLKDLSRFLQENPEYGVPPEWADVVKQSVSKKRNIIPSKYSTLTQIKGAALYRHDDNHGINFFFYIR